MEHNKETVSELIKAAVLRINDGVSRTLTARRVDETPPQHSRHLTDTRTRVSTLLEYALSYELNHILLEKKEGYSVSNVLWNVFPDLLIRDPDKENVMGLEVKALHTAAEEKSANLHTPLPLIRKGRDFIVILIWGWVQDGASGTQIIYPHIHYHDVFDAWLIAKIRDTTWLINSRDRIKGIDISTPIISANENEFKAEEGNLGKLMRINMSNDTSRSMPYYDEMHAESERYESFKAKALSLGVIETIKDIAFALGTNPHFESNITSYPNTATLIATTNIDNKNISFVAGPQRRGMSWSDVTNDSNVHDRIIVYLGSKLEWKVISGRSEVIAKGKKPESELSKIIQAITD